MTNDRPTTAITTTGGHSVVFRTYITGGEKRQITEIYITAMRGKATGADVEVSVEYQAENKAIEFAVVSLDGMTENLVERILDLPLEDFDEIRAQVKEITEGKKKS